MGINDTGRTIESASNCTKGKRGRKPESIHLEDEKREKRRASERSIDDEVYGEFYKSGDDVNHDESNKSNNP